MIRWIWIFMLLVLTAHTTRGQGGWYDSVPVSESQTIRQGNATWDESHQWWKLELEEDEHGTGGDYAAYIFAHLSGVRKGRKYHFRYKLRGEAPGSFDAGKLRIVTDENMSQGNLYAYFSVQSYPRPNQWMEVSFTATDESFWMMLGAVKKSATTSTTVYIDSISLYELAEPKNACSCNYDNNRYRYGFNGQEQDNEIYGRGNSTTAEFWQYDSRLGRRWDNDPVVKPWRSSYDVLDNSPIWKIDPKGDDDFFNTDGTFSHSTKEGTQIQVMTSKDGYKLISQLNPGNLMNRKRLAKVTAYYAKQVGIKGTVGVNPIPLKDGSTEVKTSVAGVLAYTQGDKININSRGSRFNKHLNDFNNFKNILSHEKDHKNKGHGFEDLEKITNSFTHAEVYLTQIRNKTFNNTTSDFKLSTISAFSSYIIGGWEDGQMSDEIAQGMINQFNNLNNGYTLTPKSIGKNLNITISYIENNKQYNKTVTKGKVERKR